jgi:hypothetical protein
MNKDSSMSTVTSPRAGRPGTHGQCGHKFVPQYHVQTRPATHPAS